MICLMRQIYGQTLMRARHLRGDMSQRELAKRGAAGLGRPSAAGAIQKAISRVERTLEPGVLPADLVAVLELELELEFGDLGHPYRWAYKRSAGRGGEDRLAWLGGRLPVFSAAHKAYEARGWVTFDEGRVIRELETAHPYEVLHGELERALGGDWSRMACDPTYQEFMRLADRAVAA
jgi:hypothetical protein